MAWFVSEISSFSIGGPSPSALSGGAISWYRVYGSSAVSHWREPIKSKFWVVTGDPWYPGYNTLTSTLGIMGCHVGCSFPDRHMGLNHEGVCLLGHGNWDGQLQLYSTKI
jgi:hypothetical protein